MRNGMNGVLWLEERGAGAGTCRTVAMAGGVNMEQLTVRDCDHLVRHTAACFRRASPEEILAAAANLDGARVVEGSFDVFEGAVVIYVDTPGLLVIPLPEDANILLEAAHAYRDYLADPVAAAANLDGAEPDYHAAAGALLTHNPDGRIGGMTLDDVRQIVDAALVGRKVLPLPDKETPNG